MWTQFWDMHSGGTSKENFEMCYIEAPIDEAKVIFYNIFGHNPDSVGCSCCGSNYSNDEGETLEELTAYHRNCRYERVNGEWVILEEGDPDKTWMEYKTLEEYKNSPDILVITADKIKDDERQGEVPIQGYVWQN